MNEFASLAEMFNVHALAAGATIGAVAYSLGKRAFDRMRGKDELFRNAASIEGEADNYLAVFHRGTGDSPGPGLMDKLSSGKTEDGRPDSIIMEGADRVFIFVKGKEPSIRILNLHLEADAALWAEALDNLDDPEKVHEIAGRDRINAVFPSREAEDLCIAARRRSSESAWNRVSSNNDESARRVNDAMRKSMEALALIPDPHYSLSGACHIAIRYQGGKGGTHVLVKPTTIPEREFFKKRLGYDELRYFRQDGNKVAEALFDVRQAIAQDRVAQAEYRQKLYEAGFAFFP